MKHNSQQGSFLLFFAIAVVPLMVVLSGIGIIQIRLNREQATLQHIADRAALTAAKKLPFTQAAYDAARAILIEEGIAIDQIESAIDISSSRVKISFAFEFALVPKALLPRSYTTIQIAAKSQTAINAKDVVLFIDTSSYMGPRPDSSIETTWNTPGPGSSWPGARYFVNLQSGANQLRVGGEELHPRGLTQQCFNPAFSALKEASIRLYDYFARNTENSIGVLIGPSSIQNVAVIRNLIAPNAKNTSPGEGRFDFYRNPVARDEYCLAASKNELQHPGYRVPPRGDPYFWGNPNLQPFVDAPPSIMTINEVALDVQRLPELSMRDIIWSLAVRRGYHNNVVTPAIVDFNLVIEKVANLLIDSPSRSDRSGQNQVVSKFGVLMMGDIPWVNGIRLSEPAVHSESNPPVHRVNRAVHNAISVQFKRIEERARKANVKVQLLLSVTKHAGMYPRDRYPGCVATEDSGGLTICDVFGFDTKALADLLAENAEGSGSIQNYTEGKFLQINLLRSPDTEALAKSLPAWLPLIDRTVLKVY